MSSESIITHVTPVGGNIFADLEFEADEAARLLAEADAVISEKLAIKKIIDDRANCDRAHRARPGLRQGY